MFHTKNFIFTAIFLVIIGTTAHTQEKKVTYRDSCFPSGRSLTYGMISEDGKHVALSDMNYNTKIFNTQEKTVVGITGTFVEAMSSYFAKKEYQKQYYLIRDGKEQNPQYLYSGNPIHIHDEVVHSFVVKDLESAIVTSFETKGYLEYYFDDQKGVLLIENSSNEKIFLIHPKRKVVKLDYKKYQRVLRDGYQVSPKRNYIATQDHNALFNLQTGKLSEELTPCPECYKDPISSPEREAVFNEEETQITIGHPEKGLLTFEISTGKLLSTISIPSDLPKIQGFTVVPAPNQKDFLYYLHWYHQQPIGFAYWVSDGVGTTFCDPLWSKEASENNSRLLNESVKYTQEVNAAKEAVKQDSIAARRRADKAYEEYAKEHAEEIRQQEELDRTTKLIEVQVKCDACYGTGSISEAHGYSVTYTGSLKVSTPLYIDHVCYKCNGKRYNIEKKRVPR